MARALRDGVILLALAIVAFRHDRGGTARVEAEARGGTDRYVILVVADGLRWREVFHGADPALLASAKDNGDARARFGADDTHSRRASLMPFVWGTMARHGQVIGNRSLGSSVRVTNPYKFSYPGYNELLTGIPDPRIDRNTYGSNPNVTVFEWLNRADAYRGRVAVVGAWDTFADIFNVRRSGLPMHASRVEPPDRRAHVAAMRFLRERQPRALFVAYVETDDHAHAGDYPATLRAAADIDRYLAALWSLAQANPRTRGRTTLIFTTDHGRGRGADWKHHSADIPGSDEVFLAIMGPDTPARGEVRGGHALAQAQVAATVAAALGEDFSAAIPRAAPPIAALFRTSQTLRSRVAAQ